MARIWPFSRASGSRVYTVYEPPGNAGTPLQRAERLVFVAEGFSWRAAFFGPLYLAVKREWVGLAIYVAVAVTVVNVLRQAGAEPQWISWAILILNVITGFELSSVQRASLARAGWRELGSVSGGTPEEAERRFFAAWLETVAAEKASAPPYHPTAFAPAASGMPHHESVSRAESLLNRLSSRLTRKSATEP